MPDFGCLWLTFNPTDLGDVQCIKYSFARRRAACPPYVTKMHCCHRTHCLCEKWSDAL